MPIIDEGHLRADADAMQLLSRCTACSWPCMRNPGAVAHAGRDFERLLADSIARPAAALTRTRKKRAD